VRVLLVNMPWALIDVPSLALGILRRAAAEALPDAEVDVWHANLEYVDWAVERGGFTAEDYRYYSLTTYFSGVGDWVFTSALYDDPEWRVPELLEQVPMSDEHRDRSLELHRSAPEFVRELAQRIVAAEPDLVGFTSTFQQNVPALAVAKAVKELAPHIRTAIGGANCDGSQGEALHRNFGCLDYVFRGEGEATFPALLRALRDGGPVAGIPGLCWRDEAGTPVVNAMSSRPLAPVEIVSPDYDGYFERFAESAACDWAEPKLVVESARGCWWGEKHHCKFCGLNGSFMQFRSKSPAAFRDELFHLVGRHQVLDLFVVDNILDMGYLKSLLPDLIESGYDLRMQYEIKSNLRREQLATLSRAGIVSVQPGIENLNSRVLKIMDKGVTGCQNVRMLRDAASEGLTVMWNYLYGFPGEAAEDYLPVIEQFPALHHLPAVDGIARIVVERFSPYFNQPELGFTDPVPAKQYSLNYDLPPAELQDLAYVFRTSPHGVDETVGDRLRDAAETWQQAFPHSRLTHTDLGAEILLVSRRAAFPWRRLRLTDPAEVAVFRLLDQPHDVPALHRKLAAAGHEPPEPWLVALLDRWRELGLVFTESGTWVQIAPVATNQDVLRIGSFAPAATDAADAAELAGAPA
jgi:ribosomal peptide maturation radical SAM protein 1